METTGPTAGSGDDATPAADQGRDQPGVSEETLSQLIGQAKREFWAGPPIAERIRRKIEQLVYRGYGKTVPVAIYLGAVEFGQLRAEGGPTLVYRCGDLYFDSVAVYLVHERAHLEVYGGPR